eukprot:g2169.t1
MRNDDDDDDDDDRDGVDDRYQRGLLSVGTGSGSSSPMKTPAMFTFSPTWKALRGDSAAPPTRTPSGRVETTVLMSTYNLTSTILGAGILSLPFAFRESGIVAGVCMLVVTAVLSNFSCGLVLSSYVWTHKASYGDIAGKLYGRAAQVIVEAIVMLLNIGACAAYMLVVKELMPPSLAYLLPSVFGGASDELLTAILVFGIVLPLCCLRDISSLRFTSMLAFGFAIFLVVAVSVRSVQHMSSLYGDGEDPVCSVAYKPHGLVGIFRALPLFSFSYICHLNVLPVYEFLRSRSPARMRKVFGLAMFFVTVLYVVVGSFGSLRFCDHTPGDILAFPGGSDGNCGHFPTSDALITVARLAQTLTCTLALPLITLPTRLAFHSLVSEHMMPLFGARDEWRIRHDRAMHQSLLEDTSGTREERNRRSQRRVAPNNHVVAGSRNDATRGMTRVSTDKMADLRRLAGETSSQNDDVERASSKHVESPPPSPESTLRVSTPRTPMKEPLLSLEEPASNATIQPSPLIRRMLSSPRAIQFYESAVIVGLAYLLAITVPGVNVAFGLIGSTLCTVVCYILPAAFYLGATASHAKSAKPFSRLYIRRGLSRALLVYGALTGLIGTSVTVWQSFFISDTDGC